MKEKKASASVGTKMSLFEEKMKQEKAAREKEIETENRLRKKTPRLASTEEKAEVDIKKQTKDDKEEDGKKEVAFALTTQKEKQPPTPKKRTTNNAEQEKEQKKVPTPKKRKDVAPLSPASTKDSTSSIGSPQPIDCTEDTTVSDSNAFDISAILKSADAHKQLSPPPANTKAAPRPDARTPMRSSTMKVVGGATPVLAKPIFDIDLTPVQVEEPDESLSDFAKQIQAKKNEIKNLKSDMKKGSGKQPPVKPPRNNTEFPPTYEEFVATKKDGVCLSLSLHIILVFASHFLSV